MCKTGPQPQGRTGRIQQYVLKALHRKALQACRHVLMGVCKMLQMLFLTGMQRLHERAVRFQSPHPEDLFCCRMHYVCLCLHVCLCLYLCLCLCLHLCMRMCLCLYYVMHCQLIYQGTMMHQQHWAHFQGISMHAGCACRLTVRCMRNQIVSCGFTALLSAHQRQRKLHGLTWHWGCLEKFILCTGACPCIALTCNTITHNIEVTLLSTAFLSRVRAMLILIAILYRMEHGEDNSI